MFGHHRHQNPQAPANIHRYLMRQKLLAFGDDYYIENDQKHRPHPAGGDGLDAGEPALADREAQAPGGRSGAAKGAWNSRCPG